MLQPLGISLTLMPMQESAIRSNDYPLGTEEKDNELDWRYILWQGIFTCVTAVIIWIIVPTKAEILQTLGGMTGPQQSVSRKQEAAPGHNEALSDTRSGDTASQISPETISRLISTIEQLQDMISDLTLRVDDLAKQKAPALPPLPSIPGGGMPFPPPTTMPNPLGWMQKLPDYKKARVQDAFKDNAAMVRERIQALPRDRSGGQEFAEIIRQGNEDLSARLEQILSPEEYQEYQRSRPPTPANMGAMK